MDIGSVGGCLTLWSATGETANLVWKNADGTLKAEASHYSDGLWFFCPEDLAVAIGDRIKLADESSTRTFIVPDLSVGLDRVADTFHGTGPAGRTVSVFYAQGLFADVGVSHSVRVGQDGLWSFHPRYFNILGGQSASLSWSSPNGDQVYAYGVAPNITVTLNKAGFSGLTAPLAEVDIAIHGGTDAAGNATGDTSGYYSGKFRDDHGHLRPIVAGDHLTAPSLASDADWIVPQIDGVGDAATDVVSGHCYETGTSSCTRTLIVELYRTGHRRGFVFTGAEDDGSFEFNFRRVGTFYADPANVKHGDKIVVRSLQATGDWVQLQFFVP